MGGNAVRTVTSWVIVLALVRVVVLQPERCGSPTAGDVRAGAEAAVAWLVSNQQPDGSYTYRYDRDEQRDLGGYSLPRHGGTTLSLYQAADAGIAGALDAADDAALWALERTEVTGEAAEAFAFSTGVVDTGATALLVAALAERRLNTGETVFDRQLRRLGRHLVGQVEDSGAVSAYWDRDTGLAEPGVYSIFYTGEAGWALARLHRIFPDDGFGVVAMRVLDYLALERDEAEDRFPPSSDHWAAYLLAEVAEADSLALQPHHRTYARELAEIFGVQIRYESQRSDGWFTHLTRGRPTSGSGLGTLGEGLGQLWRLPDLDPESRSAFERRLVAERSSCVAGVLLRRQASSGDGVDPREAGAWFQFGITQVDDQQHALSALLFAEAVLTFEEGPR